MVRKNKKAKSLEEIAECVLKEGTVPKGDRIIVRVDDRGDGEGQGAHWFQRPELKMLVIVNGALEYVGIGQSVYASVIRLYKTLVGWVLFCNVVSRCGGPSDSRAFRPASPEEVQAQRALAQHYKEARESEKEDRIVQAKKEEVCNDLCQALGMPKKELEPKLDPLLRSFDQLNLDRNDTIQLAQVLRLFRFCEQRPSDDLKSRLKQDFPALYGFWNRVVNWADRDQVAHTLELLHARIGQKNNFPDWFTPILVTAPGYTETGLSPLNFCLRFNGCDKQHCGYGCSTRDGSECSWSNGHICILCGSTKHGVFTVNQKGTSYVCTQMKNYEKNLETWEHLGMLEEDIEAIFTAPLISRAIDKLFEIQEQKKQRKRLKQLEKKKKNGESLTQEDSNELSTLRQLRAQLPEQLESPPVQHRQSLPSQQAVMDPLAQQSPPPMQLESPQCLVSDEELTSQHAVVESLAGTQMRQSPLHNSTLVEPQQASPRKRSSLTLPPAPAMPEFSNMQEMPEQEFTVENDGIINKVLFLKICDKEQITSQRLVYHATLKTTFKGSFGTTRSERVVVKLFDLMGKGQKSAKEAWDEFTLEFQILSALGQEHKGIVRFKHHLQQFIGPSPYMFLVMANEGIDLGMYVRDYPKQIVPSVLQSIASQLLDVFRFLHFHQTCHRDVKPANILVKMKEYNYPEIRLCDFAMSRNWELEGTCKTKSFVGTGERSKSYDGTWYAPEVVNAYKSLDQNVTYGRKSDIWPLGLVFLYVASEGENPIKTEKLLEECYKNKYIRGKTLNVLMDKGVFFEQAHPLLWDLISSHMVRPEDERTALLLTSMHPYFWSNEMIATLINLLGNTFKEERNTTKVRDFIQALNHHFEALFPTEGWIPGLQELVSFSDTAHHYNTHKVSDFIRVMRNAFNHYEDMLSKSGDESFKHLRDTVIKDVVHRFPYLLPTIFGKLVQGAKLPPNQDQPSDLSYVWPYPQSIATCYGTWYFDGKNGYSFNF